MMLCPINRLPCDSTGCGNGRCFRRELAKVPSTYNDADAWLRQDNAKLRAEVAKLQAENARLRMPRGRSRR